MASRQPYPLDHATHLPVLIGIGISIPSIRSITEYGSGLYSTPTFLDKCVFPNLESLQSFEPDSDWSEKVYAEVNADDRCMIYANDQCPRPDDDLVFIDNGPLDHKVNTIRKVFESGFTGLVVVHDSEVEKYKEEFYKFPFSFESGTFCPHTIVCCNRVIAGAVCTVGSIIAQHWDVSPDSINRWINIFKESL